jgi:hypothetical protein
MSQVDPAKLRYAVLHHGGVDEPHYDLMFETRPGSDLATWRSPAWPIYGELELTRLRDHRRIYLDYQGELSLQRGTVTRVAEGTCQLEIDEDSVWIIQLDNGIKLRISLVRDNQWRVVA